MVTRVLPPADGRKGCRFYPRIPRAWGSEKRKLEFSVVEMRKDVPRKTSAAELSTKTSHLAEPTQVQDPTTPDRIDVNVAAKPAVGDTAPHDDLEDKRPASAASFTFQPPPKLCGLSKKAKRKLNRASKLRAARKLATQIEAGKVHRQVQFEDVDILLDDRYSYAETKHIVDELKLVICEPKASVTIRRFSAGEEMPSISKLLPRSAITSAIHIMAQDKSPGTLLAQWADSGVSGKNRPYNQHIKV